ncbi:MAG: discoidin domain-containing protein [Bacteroidales bacterium]|nr:discoidin domain-containing protein [Bacteroidales bacterium]
MKKQLLWVLTLVLLALFPYQNVNADLVNLGHSGWTIFNVSSQYAGQDDGQYVTGDKAIDGNNSTYWHSDWDNAANKKANQWIVFDLGSVQEFSAFNYISRAAAEASNGNIGGYKLYISTETPTIGSLTSTMTEIKSGTFTYPAQEHLIELDQEYSARYVMLYSTSTYGVNADNTNLFANCAEFYLYKEGYCAPSGNMANTGNGAGRKLNSFTLSDGASQLEVPNIQTSATDAVYKDKTALVLTTSPGATLSFSALSWTGSWMHGYVFIDYGKDKEFNQTLNANGATTEGELVSYNFYSSTGTATGTNSLGASASNNCGVTQSNMPQWTLPANLEAGDYRLRFKVDWNSIDACGSSSIAADNGCVVDVTLRVEAPITSRTIAVVASPTEGGVVKANGTVGGVTAEGVITITAEANAGYRFLRWINTDTQAEVTTNAEFSNNEAGNISYTAVFEKIPTYAVSVSANNNDMGEVEISASEVLEGGTVTLTATPNSGFIFVNWTVGGTEVSRSATYEATVTAATAYVANFAEKQYCTNFGTSTRTGVDRNLVSLNFNDDNNTNTAIAVNQTTGSGAQIYFDKTSNVITLAKGIDVTPAINWNGWAMHGYLYVDWNGDKEFTPRLGANGVPTEDSEIIAYSYYNGRNHKGTSVGESTDAAYPKAMPNFTIPESIQNGEYRARYMIVWSKMDPCTLCNTDNAPVVVDFTIKVTNATPTNSRKQDLFTSANISQANNIYPYRIPGITSTNKDGRLIATAARLVCGTDPGYGRVDAVCRISDDNGVTWGAEKTIAAGNENLISATQNVFEIAYGDPAVVADRESGEVIVIVVAGCTTYQAATRSNPNMIGIIRSENYGDTWGTPVNITEDIYKLFDGVNAMESAFVGGGKVFQSRVVKVGNYYRLYAAMCARPNGNRVIYSDDFGRTWKPLGGAAASITPDNGNEPKCEELPDGRVILSSRNANGNGRLYNIYTYTNTATGAGSWSSCTASTFEGSNHAPGSNNTNGEILIVPVKRNNDNKEMYLALQSQPTGSDRVNVGIYYKELTNLDDMNTVSNFATGWNGFYQVSTTQSAYSSMDLQDDGKVGFLYEETLTRDGTVANPTTTCLSGGTHNFDGYNNIYRAFTIEQLTNNAYSLKTDVNRGNFVKTYLTSVVDASNLPTATKNELKADITAMGNNPTTEEVDAIYTVLNADPWDGKIVTFTNIQSNGDQRALYITGSVLSLGTTSQTAESIGASAQFLCTKQANGKYSFKNIATNEYMIWRATDGANYSHNGNKGTLSSYNATYCDWLINDANSTKEGTYCLVGKRDDGTTDGSLIVAQSNGAFDAFGADPICGTYTNGSNYSNVYYINIVSSDVEQTIETAKTLINKTGVGYPKANASARTTLQNAINAAEADASVVNGLALQSAIDAYYTTTDVELPTNGVLYSFIVGHGTQYYIYNNGGTLAVAPYTKGETVLPETAKFTCEVNGNYFMFRTSDGNYMAFPGYGTSSYSDASPDGIEAEASDKTKFSLTKLYNNVNADVTESNESLFGKIYLTVLLRGHKTDGDVAESGVFVIKIGNDYRFDGALKPYDNGSFSSAISVVAMGYPLTATASPAEAGTATVSASSVEIGGSATFTASTPNAGYNFIGWYKGEEQVSTNLEYLAENINEPLSLTAKYVAQLAVNVTVPSTFGKVTKDGEEVNGSISGNAGETVQLTAVADEGYIFDRWVVKNTATNQIRLKSTTTIDVELGTYEVEAYFAPEAYAQICKPTFQLSGNVFTVKSASITDGDGVANGDIVGTVFNMKNASEVQIDLGEPAQWGATKAITIEPGATFTLNIEYMKNWGDVELFINEGDGFETLYGPYEGSASAGLAFTNMQNDDKISTSESTASFPITIGNAHKNGDIVVIRSTSGSFAGDACKASLSQGGYLDFVFVIDGCVPSRTINVNVEPAESATILMNEESNTSLTTEGAIEITVQPKTGYVFENWTDKDGNVISSEPTIIDKTEGDKTYTANLVRVWNVTATSNNGEWGTVRIEGGLGEGVFKNATTATLVAEPKTGYKFIQWTLNGKTISTEAIYETVIMKSENYIAEFEKVYIEMAMYYALAQDKVAFEERANRYLASVTAVAGKDTENELTTVVFDTQEEIGLQRVDAESTAYARTLDGEAVPTTTGALIDETGNTIKVLVGTTTLDLNFKAWLQPITVSGYIAQPELNETQQAIYVDWNNDRDFMDDGENYNKVDNTYPNPDYILPDGYNRQITIPENIQPGLYRMRVVYYDPTILQAELDWTQDLVDETLDAGERVINQGRAYDFAIRVREDRDYITFTAPGGTFFHIEDNAEITLTYPDEEATIYYTIDGTDPNSYDPTLKSGGTIALNTYKSGEIDIKARVGENGTIYSAKYYVASASSTVDAPIITSDENASTIIAAEIKNGTGIENGVVDYQFSRGQKVVLDAIPITSTPEFTFDITYEMSNYGLTIWRLDVLDNDVVKSAPLLTSNTTGAVDMDAYATFLTNENKTYTRDGNNFTLSFDIADLYQLNTGNSIIIRAIASNKQTQPASGETIDVTYYDTYGVGEYVDFVFTVAPKEEKIKLYGTEGKNIAVSVTTTEDCFLAVGGTTKNMTAGETVPVEAKMNAAGEIAIEAVGGNISGIDIEMLECGTNILLPETDLVKTVKLKSDVDFNATTISYASVLPEEGVLVEVEKEIMLPYDKDGNGSKPAFYNFLSMPFDFDPGINVEYYDQSTGTWKPATLEQDIRILLYNSATRACGTQYYGKNWQKLSGTGGMIFANKGFVVVGNVKHDNGDHKMKLRFKSFYAEQAQPGQPAVTREIKYEQDGNPKSVRAINYRSTVGETHPFDDDWQHLGSPYLTHSDGIDYILYYHDGYKYIPVSQIEAPTIAAFQSVMFQANLGDIAEQNIVITPLAASSRTKMAQSVYGRAYLAINDEESVKIMLSDEASENFVVNEDAWYLEPTSNNEATMSVNVAGSEASITVQPEPTEMPLTVYTGVKSTQTISLSRVDGDVNIYLKDAVTDEVVCLNDEDYTFEASPKTTIANRFTISMTEPTGIEDNTISTSDIKVVVNGDNLTIYGTETGETVTLYTINGTVLATAEAEDGVTTIETTATGVVVVKVGTEAVKVVIP